MPRTLLVALFALISIALPASAKERAYVDLRVVTYNIHHGVGMDGVLDLERIAALLDEERPDIVALNEVDKGIPRSRRVDEARALAERLGMGYVFGSNLRYFGGEYGNAILTRFPILYQRNVHLRARGRERRGLLHVAVEVEGSLLHVMTTHLEVREPKIRDAQVREIAEYVAGLSGPVILMGDFNSEAGMRDPSGMLFPRLQDAWVLERVYFGDAPIVTGGWPQEGSPTFDSKSPKKRIDYVFVSEALRPAGPGSVRTVPSIASDHLPVVAELRFEPQTDQAPSQDARAQDAPSQDAPTQDAQPQDASLVRAVAGPGVARAVGADADFEVIATGPRRALFVSGLGTRDRDADRFKDLYAPGVDVIGIDLGGLVARDAAGSADAFDMVVLHNQTTMTRRSLEWLEEYKRAGGSIVALGNVGLRFEDPTSIPAEGAVVAALFSVKVVGWTRSVFVEARHDACDRGVPIPLPPQGMLHMRPADGGRAVLSYGSGCGREGAPALAVASPGTLYVGIDPLAAASPPAELVDALRRWLSALPGPARRPTPQHAQGTGDRGDRSP